MRARCSGQEPVRQCLRLQLLFVLLLMLLAEAPGRTVQEQARGQEQQRRRQQQGQWQAKHPRLPAALAPAAAGGASAVRTISVIGERHSGTNYMRQLIQKNFENKHVQVMESFCSHKHNYQSPLSPSCPPLGSSLVIVMLRNPLDWAAAMHRQCWCAEGDAAMAKLPLGRFLEHVFKERNEHPELSGGDGGDTCSSLMKCRERKYLNFLNMSSWAPRVEFVRYEDVLLPDAARGFLTGLRTRHGLQPSQFRRLEHVSFYKNRVWQEFDPLKARGQSLWFKLQDGQGKSLSKADKATVRTILEHCNTTLEKLVGYDV